MINVLGVGVRLRQKGPRVCEVFAEATGVLLGMIEQTRTGTNAFHPTSGWIKGGCIQDLVRAYQGVR